MQNEKNRQSRRRSNRQKQKKALWKKILLGIGSLILVAGLGLAGVVTYWIATSPAIDEDKLVDPLPSEIYDVNGKFITSTGGAEQRIKITYDDLPQLLVDAVTATEDARFFDHHGVDIRRIAGAIKANITQGFGAEGASTITQQVVENAFLTPEKKIKLKVQEQWLSLKLEREYSKEQILEMYLNKIFYGSNSYGVAQAAKTYFGKEDLHDLTLAESAILAGLPQRPSGYNPFKYPELAEKRMHTVLNLMVRHEKITEEEANEAKKVKVEDLLVEKQPVSDIPYPAYREQIEDEIRKKLPDVDMNTAGLKIYTNLDIEAQDHVELLLSGKENNPIAYPDDLMKAGIAVLDSQTGGIAAIGGRRSDQGDYFNYAIQGRMQPGSTAKPYMAYAPAIEKNKISTYHQINDDKPYTPAGEAEIRNWDRQYHGWVSMRQALSNSWNVPAVKTLEETGVTYAQDFAEKLGATFHNDQAGLRDAIGGTTSEVSPLQLAGIYQSFANQGVRVEPHAVNRVEYPDGKTVDLKPESEIVMADYTAYMITDMLKSVVESGTGIRANVGHLPVAGKTGTTSLENKTGSPDAWFVGYTTNYTISSWVGGYQDSEGRRDVIPDGYTTVPQFIFKNLITEISKKKETADFKKPSSVVELSIAPGSNPARIVSSGGVKELFVKGHEPSKQASDKNSFPAVTDLKASYDESNHVIDVSWKHKSEEDATFEITISSSDGSSNESKTTTDTDISIGSISPGETYTIQVIAISSSDKDTRSEPRSVTVETGDAEEDELGTISNLQANYVEESNSIDVSWDYDGDDAQFEVEISPSNQRQTTSNTSIEIPNIQAETSYSIKVTPISADGERGDSASTTIVTPPARDDEDDEDDDNNENQDDNNDDNEQSDETNQDENDNDENNEQDDNNTDDEEHDEDPELDE